MIFFAPWFWNKWNSFSQEKLCTWPHFEGEGFWNSEVACWPHFIFLFLQGYDSIDNPKAVSALKYMLLCKIMLNRLVRIIWYHQDLSQSEIHQRCFWFSTLQEILGKEFSCMEISMADSIGILLLCLIFLMCEWGTLLLNFLFLPMFIFSKNLITFSSAFHQLYTDNIYPDEDVCFIFSNN